MNSTFLETNIPLTGNPNLTFPLLYSHFMTEDCSYNFQDFESSSFLNQLLVDYSPTNNNFNTSLLENPIMQEISSTINSGSSGSTFYAAPPNINHLKEKSKVRIIKNDIKMNERHVVAFRTKTQLEILDDGYKWRKYGKKKVKSNTNPRDTLHKAKANLLILKIYQIFQINKGGHFKKVSSFNKNKKVLVLGPLQAFAVLNLIGTQEHYNYHNSCFLMWPFNRNYYKCSIQECNVKKRVERDGHDSSYLIATYEGRHNHERNSSIIYNHEMPLSLTLQTT